MIKLEISLKRVQTFIFEVPRLKAMLGANALIGQVMRHELPKLLGNKGLRLAWPKEIRDTVADDPLNGTADPDQPSNLYEKGILARDGGRFIAVFAGKAQAEAFLREVEQKLAQWLPGVLFDASFDEEPKVPDARETQILDLPVLQVCQETGREPASYGVIGDNREKRWRSRSATYRLAWGRNFKYCKTRDIIGLMRGALYPRKMGWEEPDDLAQLASGGYVALIHADGNGIGKRYNDWRDQASGRAEIEKDAHGEAFFHGMRVAVRRALVDALAKTFTDAGGKRPDEVLMLGGDDLLLICRADRALNFSVHYAAELQKYNLADGAPLDVAIGVAIVQKTYPLHRLHELAESLASSAKRLYRSLAQNGEKNSVIDWQVVTQSWFEGVAQARRKSDRIQYTVNGKTETLLLTGRPYRVLGEQGLEFLVRKSQELDHKDDQAARSPLRSLRTACERGRLNGQMAFGKFRTADQTKLGWQNMAKYDLWTKL
ncbi:MAG: Cas10/Cmr2 second palm domain-containing protein, partial [Methylococcales bacterium]